VNFIALKLDVGFDFNSHVQEEIHSPKIFYRDKSNSYASALENVINIYNSQTKTLNVSADSYYQNENAYSVYKELRDNI
jgi:hypothetical protein